jgi:Raf kinase inhibitor-like YbhB/YbcL family protein
MTFSKHKKILIMVIGLASIAFSLEALSRRMVLERNEKKYKKGFFRLTSPAFTQGELIPKMFTCEGQDISPELVWRNPPSSTQSFVLIMHDPDDALEGVKIQWLVYDIPNTIRKLPQRVNVASINAKLGINSWDEQLYIGPCPPLKVHRYFFTLYALDIPMLIVDKIPDEQQIKEAMQGHILGKAVLLGRYQRLKIKQ